MISESIKFMVKKYEKEVIQMFSKILHNTVRRLIDWLNGILRRFWQYFSHPSSPYSCLYWVSPKLGWGLKCLAQGHSLNKRAMMALNRSPESVSPQNEFYLLYYYSSDLWPPGWGQFWPQGYHMNRIDIGPNIIVQGQMIKALLLPSEKKNFKVFLLCSYVSNLWRPGRDPIWPHGHHMNNFGRGPLGDATYEISKLCTL